MLPYLPVVWSSVRQKVVITVVEFFERNVDFWKYRLIEDLDALVDLSLLNITLPLEEVYDGIMLPLD